MRLLIALVVWAGAAVGAVALSSAVAHTVHKDQVKATAKVAVSQSKPAPAPFDPASVTPADRRSLFVGSNFARAIALVRRHVGPRADVEMVETFPGQLEMTVLRGGSELSIVARIDGEYLASSGPGPSGPTQVFSLAQVHTDVPRALARRIAAHGHVPVSKLNFMQLRIDPVQHSFHWYVYPKRDNVYFQADTASSPIQEFNHGRPHAVIRG